MNIVTLHPISKNRTAKLKKYQAYNSFFIKKDMNRKLLVTLLRKNIEELGMITEGFMEMNEYPQAIIQLAKRKTEDIQTIIDELASITGVVEQIMTSTEIIKPEPQVELEETVVLIEEETIPEETKIEELKEDEIPEEPIQTIAEVEETPIVEITLDEIETIVEQETIIEHETTIIQTTEIEEIGRLVETTQTTETVVSEVKTHTEEVKKVTIADRMANQSTSRNERLSQADNSLSASIANKKITDIKQAISIGDRFRFQRELFKSNGEDMNKTLTYLNQLATLDEAMSFLKSKYAWENSNEAVEDFYQIVKRKFV